MFEIESSAGQRPAVAGRARWSRAVDKGEERACTQGKLGVKRGHTLLCVEKVSGFLAKYKKVGTKRCFFAIMVLIANNQTKNKNNG